jgi:uncharacterized protein YjbI with pentapeptide repeats
VNASLLRKNVTATVVDSFAGSMVSTVSLVEGNEGTTKAQFCVEFASPSAQMRGVRYSTADGSAKAPGDCVTPKANMISFPSGLTSTTVDVTVNSNTNDQGHCDLKLNVSGAITGTGTTVILEDEAASSTTTATTVPARCSSSLTPNVDDHDCELDKPTFSGLDLPGAHVSGATLVQINVGGANLTGVNLTFTDMTLANLMGAELTSVSWPGRRVRTARSSSATSGRRALQAATRSTNSDRGSPSVISHQ